MAAKMALTLWTVYVAALISVTVVTVSSRLCYNCHLAPRQNNCMNSGVLLDARMAYERVNSSNHTADQLKDFVHNSEYMSECSETMDHCVIERILVENEYKLMYRDCSDGSKFSTNVTSTRLESMPKDNVTHCAYQDTIAATVCITLCQGDFCNGPQYNAAAALGSSWLCTALGLSATVMTAVYMRSSVFWV